MRLSILFIVVLPFAIFSEIRHGTATLEYDYGTESMIDFDEGTVETYAVDRGTYDSFHDCETSFGSGDLILCDGAVPTCAYPCRNFGVVGSSRPICQLHTAADFSESLSLDDTTLFNLKDSIFQPDSRTTCRLPNIVIQKEDVFQSGYNITLIMQTDQNRYVLVFVDPFTATVESDELGYTKEFVILQGCHISWFLQDDGSTDFSGYEQLHATPKIACNTTSEVRKQKRYSIRCMKDAVHLGNVSSIFTLRGSKVEHSAASSMSNLIVIEH